MIQEFVVPQYRAYHAGPGNLSINSKLNPNLSSDIIKNDMNSWSIGIENVNTGNEEFTLKQIEANIYVSIYAIHILLLNLNLCWLMEIGVIKN